MKAFLIRNIKELNFDAFMMGQDIIVAMTPLVMYELDLEGMPYNIPEDFIYPERFKGIPMFWDDVFYLSYFETIELEKYWKKLIGALKKKGYEIVPEITAKSVLE